MILKTNKKNILAYISLLAIVVSCLTYFISIERGIITKALRNHYLNFYDSAMAFDLGFSSLRNISLDPKYGTAFGWSAGLLKKVPEIVFKNLRGFRSRPPINAINIDIKLQDYLQLLEDREKAMRIGFLHSPNKIKAKIFYKEKRYKAEIRLKGDMAQHWRSRHRMSLRVAIKGKHNILGFKKFSLHKVSARQFPYDHEFQSLMRRAGNLSAVHKYLRVFVNGKNWGIMNVEEHMSKELLEKQGRKDSIIVKFENVIRNLSFLK